MEGLVAGFRGCGGCEEGSVTLRFKPFNFPRLIQKSSERIVPRVCTRKNCVWFIQTSSARAPSMGRFDTVGCYHTCMYVWVNENQSLIQTILLIINGSYSFLIPEYY
jgi:hypothetical protein